ncbi:uncharacterized protein LOC142338341 isoform X2 [Convolutriloba macropyga]|uniref:uncharacterized protein LOC142338341 isoform X2 n=1 Tax=Convolutriloba macropyga TaxID=536237 RepID=UPI003F5246A6
MLPGSRTPDVKNLVQQSNVEANGLFIYKLTEKKVQKYIGCKPKIEPDIAHMYFEVERFHLEGFLCDQEPGIDSNIEVVFSGSAQEVKVEGKLTDNKKSIFGNFPFWGKAETVTVRVVLNGQKIAGFAKMAFVTCNNYRRKSGEEKNYLSVKITSTIERKEVNKVDAEITFTWNPEFFVHSTTEIAFRLERILRNTDGTYKVASDNYHVIANNGSKTYLIEMKDGFSFVSIDVSQDKESLPCHINSTDDGSFSLRNCSAEIGHDDGSKKKWRNVFLEAPQLGCPRNSFNGRGQNDAWFAHADVRTGSWTYDPCCPGSNKPKSEAFYFCSDCKMNRGADFCIISRAVQFHTEVNSEDDLKTKRTSTLSNQCCYDRFGRLLRDPRHGAGTAKRSIPNSGNLIEFFDVEYSFYKSCCVDEDKCDRYREYRYPMIGSYIPRRTSINRGDPHIVTLDGFKYTFNGLGVFTMIELRSDGVSRPNMTVQASMRRVGNGTIFSGVVASDLTTSAELFLTPSGQVVISINGSRLEGFDENTRTIVSDGCLFTEEAPSVERDAVFLSLMRSGSGSKIQTEFTLRMIESGLVISAIIVSDEAGNKILNLGISPPSDAVGKLRGLLGNFDGDMSNDLALKNETFLPLTSNMTFIHHNFGDSWKVERDMWLFAIDSRMTIDDDIEIGSPFTPVYEAVFQNPQIESKAKQKCGADKNCLLDVALTGNLQLADNWKQMEELMDIHTQLLDVYLESSLSVQSTEETCDFSCLFSTPVMIVLTLIMALFATISATVIIAVKRRVANSASNQHQMTYSQLIN